MKAKADLHVATRRGALLRLGRLAVGGLAAGLGASALLLSCWAPGPARELAHRLPRLRVVPLRLSDLEVDHELAG